MHRRNRESAWIAGSSPAMTTWGASATMMLMTRDETCHEPPKALKVMMVRVS
jgi:hypothetical protein